VAASKMLLGLCQELKERKVEVRIVEALSEVREILRKQGLEEFTGHLSRKHSIEDAIDQAENA
jgi:sulfate permease, SulP family